MGPALRPHSTMSCAHSMLHFWNSPCGILLVNCSAEAEDGQSFGPANRHCFLLWVLGLVSQKVEARSPTAMSSDRI